MPTIDEHNRDVIASFRRHGGKVGARYTGLDLLLLHHTGARTGTERVVPLLYWPATAASVAVLASNSGAPARRTQYVGTRVSAHRTPGCPNKPRDKPTPRVR